MKVCFPFLWFDSVYLKRIGAVLRMKHGGQPAFFQQPHTTGTKLLNGDFTRKHIIFQPSLHNSPEWVFRETPHSNGSRLIREPMTYVSLAAINLLFSPLTTKLSHETPLLRNVPLCNPHEIRAAMRRAYSLAANDELCCPLAIKSVIIQLKTWSDHTLWCRANMLEWYCWLTLKM